MFRIETANDNLKVEQATCLSAMRKTAFHNALLQTELRQALADLGKALTATKVSATS